jgi:hydroxymethylbilane synthase
MRVGTRGSALALAQTRALLELIGPAQVRTTAELAAARGAGSAAQPESSRGADKSRWVADLERALLDREIDLAVHSAKDVPGELAEGLELVGALTRAPACDLLVLAPGTGAQLPKGARVGTSSLRRAAQLHAWRSDIEAVPIAGNVDSRLAKLAAGADDLDALVLAAAALERLRVADVRTTELRGPSFVPAPGQGTIALQARSEDQELRRAIEPVCDQRAFACLRAERALGRALEASCAVPLGAHAQILATAGPGGGMMELQAWVGLPDGSQWIADRATGEPSAPESLGRAVAERLRSAGAQALLDEALAQASSDV